MARLVRDRSGAADDIAYLAIADDHPSLTCREAAEAIEEGYRDSIATGGKAFVLAENHQWLRLLATSKLRDPMRFWTKIEQLPPYSSKPPVEARKLIEEMLLGCAEPTSCVTTRVGRRRTCTSVRPALSPRSRRIYRAGEGVGCTGGQNHAQGHDRRMDDWRRSWKKQMAKTPGRVLTCKTA